MGGGGGGVKIVCPLYSNILKNKGTTDEIFQQSGNLQECNAVSEIPESSRLESFKYINKQLFLFRYRSDMLTNFVRIHFVASITFLQQLLACLKLTFDTWLLIKKTYFLGTN